MLRYDALICSGLLALACAGGGGNEAAGTPEPARRNPFVRISNASLSPPSTRAKAGSRVSFVNISSYLAVVVLQASASDFECIGLGPDFEIDGDQIRSEPIGGSGNQISLPCSMKAGSYDYHVQLSAGVYAIGNQQLEYSGQLHFEARQAP